MMLFLLAGCILFDGAWMGDGAVACTEIGCQDGISIGFSLTEPGDYEITAVAGGETVHCTATLPFDGTEGCSGPGGVGISGTELPPAQQSLEGMWLDTVDATDVHLTVVRSGTVQYDETFPVSYDTLQPNGPGCEPICHSAGFDLSL